MPRINDICFIAVLNDSCAAINVFLEDLKKIDGHLCPLQLREVFCIVTDININLKHRPSFYSEVILPYSYSISVKLPGHIELEEFSKERLGHLLHFYTKNMLYSSDPQKNEEISKFVKDGRWNFLFNEKGEFIRNTA